MTSFEEPDAGLLVEHLLPSLLGGSYSLSQELQERPCSSASWARHSRCCMAGSP